MLSPKKCLFLGFVVCANIMQIAAGAPQSTQKAAEAESLKPSETVAKTPFLGSHLVDIQLPENHLLSIYRTGGGENATGWPFNKMFSVVCVVSRVKAPAELTSFDLTMPEHGHGMIVNARISKVGTNSFRVDGLKMHMRGKWQLAVAVQSGASKPIMKHLTLQL